MNKIYNKLRVWWTKFIKNHIIAQVPDDDENFLK